QGRKSSSADWTIADPRCRFGGRRGLGPRRHGLHHALWSVHSSSKAPRGSQLAYPFPRSRCAQLSDAPLCHLFYHASRRHYKKPSRGTVERKLVMGHLRIASDSKLKPLSTSSQRLEAS